MDLSVLLGSGAILGSIVVFKDKVLAWLSFMFSRIIVTVDLDDGLTRAAAFKLGRDFKISSFGNNSYVGWHIPIRRLRKRLLVALQFMNVKGALYWRGWTAIWVAQQDSKTPANGNPRPVMQNREIRISFIRGTLNAEKFVSECVNLYNAEYGRNNNKTRHGIIFKFGTDGKPATNHDRVMMESPKEAGMTSVDCIGFKMLGWEPADIGTEPISGNSLEQLALHPNAERLVTDIRNWLADEEWHIERGIPWKMGCLLEGPPGNGKTALVRAIGEDLDLPIYVFDLTTLYNDELHRAWSDMLVATPCIALIEDIDSVFEGRKNTVGGHLSFDALLNCLDGAERAHGLITFITTNFPMKLDPAIGGGSTTTDAPLDMATRPNRIDIRLPMGPPEANGRLKIAKRILKDHPELLESIVDEGRKDSGAQFQYRCTRLAARKRWAPKEV